MRPARSSGPTPPAFAAVAAGGAAGAVLRYLLGTWFPDGSGFPATVLTINVVGAFLLALLPVLAVVRRSPVLAAALGPGVLGGFTTMSTFAEQTRALLDGGRVATAAAYVAVTLLAGIAAVLLADVLSTRAARDDVAAEGGDG